MPVNCDPLAGASCAARRLDRTPGDNSRNRRTRQHGHREQRESKKEKGKRTTDFTAQPLAATKKNQTTNEHQIETTDRADFAEGKKKDEESTESDTDYRIKADFAEGTKENNNQ